VPQSYERAAELFTQAAVQGDAVEQASLGVLYRDGRGVPQSYERAAKLLQQAAAQGYADAQTRLGALYLEGKGVPQDVARGVALFKQAAAGGNKPAADFLRELGEAVPPGAPGAARAPQPMD
jgi:TPR repeat protein